MAIDLKAALANPANAQKFTNDLAVTLTNVRFSEEQCAEDLIEPPGIRGELADGYGLSSVGGNCPTGRDTTADLPPGFRTDLCWKFPV